MESFSLISVHLHMQNQLTKLEKFVLDQFVSIDDVDAKRLRVQISMLTIESRTYTEVGFKTSFLLPSHLPTLSEDFNDNQANVYADHPKVPAGAGFHLISENGLIKSLNGFVFVGRWPVNESEFHILKLDYCLTNPNLEAG